MPKVLVPREPGAETRVAATPETVRRMVKEGLGVTVEAGAGQRAHFLDRAYAEAGASVASASAEAWRGADLVLKVGPLGASETLSAHEADLLRPEGVVIGLLAPYRELDTVRRLAERKVTSLAMELVPRITRAQAMDALSSQASIAGYKAVIVAAGRLGKYFPLLMTAAGTIAPARVVIMGGGVAGLQALATARRLGAVVEVSDVRPEVKEQVESLGGRFIDLPARESGAGEGGYAREMSAEFLARQRAIVKERIAAADVVITTALVPGKPAPRLVTADMVEAMRPGSVVVDLAVEQGGNCELSRPGEEVTHRGVLLLGPLNLPATVPLDASTVYARNVHALLKLLLAGGELVIDTADEVVGGTLLTHQGRVVHAATAARLSEDAR